MKTETQKNTTNLGTSVSKHKSSLYAFRTLLLLIDKQNDMLYSKNIKNSSHKFTYMYAIRKCLNEHEENNLMKDMLVPRHYKSCSNKGLVHKVLQK